MAVSIVCITMNHLPFTRLCIESVLPTMRVGDELIMVDNGSTDGTREFIQSLGIKHHFYDENMGCPIAKNAGIKLAAPENDIIILDNDNVIATPTWIDELLATPGDIVHPYVFISTPNACHDSVINMKFYSKYMKLRDKHMQVDDEAALQLIISRTYGDLDRFAQDFITRHRGENFAFTPWPGCFLLPRAVLDSIGLYDENFGKCAWYDVDLAKRSWEAGFVTATTTNVFLHHFGSVTTRKQGLSDATEMRQEEAKSSVYFRQKWGPKPIEDHHKSLT